MTIGAPTPTASVLTLVRGRQAHLDALVKGLANQTYTNFEFIIAHMQPEPPRIEASLPFHCRMVRVHGNKLPLAAARNAASAKARGKKLIFLDVDCIPSPPLVQSFIRQLDTSERCLLGEVRYLPGTLSPNELARATFNQLATYAIKHPARPCVPGQGWIKEVNTRALWGLSFALTKYQYEIAGGMDGNFVGYGGEETDFSERLAKAGIALGWCSNALALHQYHSVHSPPLDKFDDILCNAIRFHEKWGSWCMEYWLDLFTRRGLIAWTPAAEEISIIRRPTLAEIEACRQPPEVAFA